MYTDTAIVAGSLCVGACVVMAILLLLARMNRARTRPVADQDGVMYRSAKSAARRHPDSRPPVGDAGRRPPGGPGRPEIQRAWPVGPGPAGSGSAPLFAGRHPPGDASRQPPPGRSFPAPGRSVPGEAAHGQRPRPSVPHQPATGERRPVPAPRPSTAGEATRGGTAPGRPLALPLLADALPEPEGPGDCVRLRARAQVLAVHAEGAARMAAAAHDGAEQSRERYATSEAERSRAEVAYDEARLAYAEALREVHAGHQQPTPDDEERQREVTRAALAAYRRGELSAGQLRTVFSRSGDWNPAQQERERTAERLALEEGRTRRAYDAAATTERLAREALHVAETAARARTQEAVDAAVEAQVVAEAAEACGRKRFRRR
jgi:hypothetical protein